MTAAIGRGCVCPCCGQFAKRYRRRLNGSMCRALILICRHFRANPRDEWLHVENFLKAIPSITSAVRGDVAKLRHWGLIERKTDAREDGSDRCGYYRQTAKAVSFIRGVVRVPSWVEIYNGKPEAFAAELVSIRECLGKRFDYSDLMGWDQPDTQGTLFE